MIRTLLVAAELNNLPTIRRFIQESGAALAVPAMVIDDLVLAVDELATNVIRHGYRGEPGDIGIEMQCQAEAIVIRLRDHAPPFDPTRQPNTDVTAPLERRPVGGLGIFLARQRVDTMTHQWTSAGGNELTLIKIINPHS